MPTVLLARALLTPTERINDAALVIEDGIISSVGMRAATSIPRNASVVDCGDSILTPGLIDVHIHGCGGHDVMEASDDSLAAIERLMARHGVTSYCPTTVTAPLDQTLRALANLGTAVKAAENSATAVADRARPLGIHLEGPFLSHARRGVHAPMHLQPASSETFNQMWDAAAGRIRMLDYRPGVRGSVAADF